MSKQPAKPLSMEEELRKYNVLDLALDAGVPEINPLQTALDSLITTDKEMIEIKIKASKLSKNPRINVLIIGETGTGKELIARIIHGNAKGHFVGINTAGIPDGLLESEFFGAVEGAYTGAKHRLGLIEHANDGTLFLDEIGDMPLLLQSKLLRALQEREARKVGSSNTYKFNCRVVSATNKPVNELSSRKNGFRDDLFYRLAGSIIELKPLKFRGDDSILIARHLCKDLPIEFLEQIRTKEWKGNIRELINYIEEYKTLNEIKTI